MNGLTTTWSVGVCFPGEADQRGSEASLISLFMVRGDIVGR